MKYVSDIKVNGEPVNCIFWPLENAVITTHDIDTGATEKVVDSQIDDCYGFSLRLRNGVCAVARHTAQAAQLYKYITLVITCSNIPARSSDVDFCSLGSHVYFDTPQDAATRTLEIDCYSQEIEFCKPFGPVVGMGGEDYPKCLSLYDFLILLCKSTGLNIMSYRTVLFCNRHYNCSNAEITFDHRKEANRFFLKMYLDALRGSS